MKSYSRKEVFLKEDSNGVISKEDNSLYSLHFFIYQATVSEAPISIEGLF